MAEITASLVMKLRGQTDAPMMDCKKALTEADGDFARAEEILRVRFGNKHQKHQLVLLLRVQWLLLLQKMVNLDL